MFGPALAFLDDLAEHNDKAWFDANRDRYERELKTPAIRFVERMAPRIEKLSPHFRAIAKGTGSSISRMHRDTRFSADKSPFKSYLGIHFAHVTGKDAPGLHLHVSRADTGVGLGVWMLEPAQLRAVRDHIADPGSGWGEVRAALDEGGFRFIGESLKRVPKEYAADHPHGEDLKRKTFGAGRPVDPTLPEEAFCDAVEASFHAGWPLMVFLARSLDLQV